MSRQKVGMIDVHQVGKYLVRMDCNVVVVACNQRVAGINLPVPVGCEVGIRLVFASQVSISERILRTEFHQPEIYVCSTLKHLLE